MSRHASQPIEHALATVDQLKRAAPAHHDAHQHQHHEPREELRVLQRQDGTRRLRTRFGSESYMMIGERCDACGTARGQMHTVGCERETCSRCGKVLDGCVCTTDQPAAISHSPGSHRRPRTLGDDPDGVRHGPVEGCSSPSVRVPNFRCAR